MITAEQIQTILTYASKAPSTVGQAYADRPAFDALVAIGQGIASGKSIGWVEPVKVPPAS